jgi:hypothetical protein
MAPLPCSHVLGVSASYTSASRYPVAGVKDGWNAYEYWIGMVGRPLAFDYDCIDDGLPLKFVPCLWLRHFLPALLHFRQWSFWAFLDHGWQMFCCMPYLPLASGTGARHSRIFPHTK